MTTRNQFLICATVPALAMTAAHWFPWRQTLARDLHPLEAYAIGTAGIVATAAAVIAADREGDGNQHAALLLTAAAAAGVATLSAWLWDDLLTLRLQIVEAAHYGDALSYVHTDRD